MFKTKTAAKVAIIKRIIRDDLGLEDSNYLMNRQTLGIPLRDYIFNSIKQQQETYTTFILDFSEIYEASSSVADELGPVLFEKFLNYRSDARSIKGEIFLAYGNLSSEMIVSLERAFSGWSLAHSPDYPMVSLGFSSIKGETYEGFRFLGAPQLPDSLKMVLDLIYKHGDLTSNDLENLGIKAPSRKLNDINNRCPWLVRQVKVRLEETEKAWTYIYSPILPPNHPMPMEN